MLGTTDRIALRTFGRRATFNHVRRERLVDALVADGWFATLQDFPSGWCVLTDAPPSLVARMAAVYGVPVIETLRVGFARGFRVE